MGTEDALKTHICTVLAAMALYALLPSAQARAGSEAADAYQGCARQYGSLAGHGGGRAMVIGYSGPDNMRCFFAWGQLSGSSAASFATRNCENAGYAKCFLFATTERGGQTRFDDWVAIGRAQTEQFDAYEAQNQRALGDFATGFAIGAGAALGAGTALDNRPVHRNGGGSGSNCNWGACSTK